MTFSFSRIEGNVGIAVETTEGTAIRDPTTELFVLAGNSPQLNDIIDKETEIKAYNEPYLRKKIRSTSHVEGEIPGILLAPGNGLPNFIKTAFGNPWYSNNVYVLTVESGGGSSFTRGSKVFGGTSKAIGEIVKIDTDTLWLVGVQGTFGNSESLYDLPSGFDGTDSTKDTAASAGFAAVSGYYCHKMDSVLYKASSTDTSSSASSIRIYTTATYAMIADFCLDFRPYSVSSGNARCIVTVQDDAGVYLEGWLGETVMAIDYDTGTADFGVGQTLTAGGNTIGTILAVDGTTATGTLWVDIGANTNTCADDAVLADDSTPTPGAAAVNMPNIPGYLYNGIKVYTEKARSTQTWNGDITTFDETDKMSFVIEQNNYDQESLTVYVKDAGDDAMRGYGMKISELSFDIDGETYGMDISFVGRSYGYPTYAPVFPGGITTYAPYGASSKTIELDGSTSGMAGYATDYSFGASFDFSVEKGTTLNDATPTYLQPVDWGITGSTNVQWLNNTLLKRSWGATDATAPTAGDRLTSRIFTTLDSGDVVTTGYNHMFCVGSIGTVTAESLDRSEDGYMQPITIEGVMAVSGYEYVAQFMIFDATSSH